MKRFLVGSSFFDGGKGGQAFRHELAQHWDAIVAKVLPSRVVIISEAGSMRPCKLPNCDIIDLSGDLGHCDDLVYGRKQNAFAGWSGSMLALAMIAYVDEADFLYLEEDCLAFGPWVEQTYRDLGDGDIVFGQKLTSAPWMPASQSLFLVRHRFIPEFVQRYIGFGGDNNPQMLGEQKFCALEQAIGGARARRLSFGVDRSRPIPWGDPVFYFQQPTRAEVDEAVGRRLLAKVHQF